MSRKIKNTISLLVKIYSRQRNVNTISVQKGNLVSMVIDKCSFFLYWSSCSAMNDLVDKFNTAYDRHSRRGGRTAFL